MQQQSQAIARLALHQAQRCQAVPTLSVLQGDAVAARQLWTLGLNQTQQQTSFGVYTSLAALLETWLLGIARPGDLRSRILQKIAPLAGRSETELAGWLNRSSAYERQLFWQQLAPLGEDVGWLRSLLDWLPVSPNSGTPTRPLLQALQAHQGADHASVRSGFAVVARLYPPTAVPGIGVLAWGDGVRAEQALTALARLVEAVPQLPIALVLGAEQLQDLLHELPESRTKALLRGGLIEVPTWERENIRQWLGDRAPQDKQVQPLLSLAKTHGTTPELLDVALTLLEPAQPLDRAKTEEAESQYRSQAEWFLAQYLEARPTTMGHFQVNAQLEIDFGGRPMEVDFLDATAKIVIELDGYYHFQSEEAYRRDRRKDQLLQQQGFWVLRFLSQDVVSHLETILGAIDQALASRSSSIPPTNL